MKVCPECGSDKVVSEHHQQFYVNTCEHYAHVMKTHDNYSRAVCLSCKWDGCVKDLIEVNDK